MCMPLWQSDLCSRPLIGDDVGLNPTGGTNYLIIFENYFHI